MTVEPDPASRHSPDRSALPPGVSASAPRRSPVGPLLYGRSALLRYLVALLLTVAVALARWALAPWMGTQAPLLPFLALVLVVGYVGGGGPALFASLTAPVFATLLFAGGLQSNHRFQWVLHVALFLSVAIVVCVMIDRLQRLNRAQQAALVAARAAEQAVAQSAAQLRTITDAMPALITYVGPDFRYRFNNRGYGDWFGRPADSIVGQHTRDVLGAQTYEQVRPRMELALSGTSVQFEVDLPDAAGRMRSVEARYLPDVKPDGGVAGYFALVLDISERKQAEAALRESEQRMRLVTDHLPAYISYVDREGIVRFANAAYRELAEPGGKEVTARHLREVLGEEVYAQRAPFVERALRGELVRFDGPMEHPLKGTRDCEVTYVPQMTAAGEVAGFYVMANDITERMHAEGALRQQQRMLQLIYDHSSDAMFLLSLEPHEQYRVLSVNASFLHISGITREAAENRLLADVFPEQQLESARIHLQEVCRARAPVVYYEMAALPAGLRQGEVTLVPIPDSDGQVRHVLGAIKDVTARKQAEAALLQADRRKDEFLAMLAHELRNPLAAIRNVGNLLERDGHDGVRVQRYSELLRRQASQLTRLVDDLLDVARITRGTIELKREVLSLGAVLEAAIETTQPLFAVKHQALNYSRIATPLWVEGDAVRLTQVFSNLLTNASKFSPDRSMIDVQLTHTAREITVSIRDEGAGIDPEFLPRIFDIFVQADRSLDRAQGGLGVGLTIVKALLEMQGGGIEARSAGLGAGSAFIVTLPRIEQSEMPLNEVPPRGSTSAPARRILLVEDNADVAESLGMLLTLEGHLVRHAAEGAAALQELENFDAEIILLDIGLPGADGYVIAQAIRQRFPHRPHRLIALTGYGREEDRALARSSGFDGHLTKPVDPDVLIRLVAEPLGDPLPAAKQ